MRLLPFLLLLSLPLHAQRGYIVGQVLDQDSNRGVENASVLNKRTKQMGRTNRTGAYYMLVKPGDSIIVSSLTYGRAGLQWDGISKEPVLKMKRQLPDDAIELPGVTITGKREEEIKRELQQLLREPEARKGLTGDQVLSLAESPITLLYELFSKQAKSRRKATVMSQQFRRHRLADYRLDLIIGQATNLKGDDIDRFKIYCRFSDEFLLQSSEYELTYAVLQRVEGFK
ncbi:MAG: carboxypeptidase-like regulatory domain-containing protein [Cytophagaceae bacterium]|nr:carboxypeptidase-like regulatory domain-containing protein [Cytophagaceae bacterium]